MLRQIVLDTETTGLRIEDGHRIIEIGCIELIDRKFTGKKFHQFINPEREVEAGALAVHGITNHFLQDKPTFSQIVDEFFAFVAGAELIIHNAPFDVGFINYELLLLEYSCQNLLDHCSIIDTLALARKQYAGQRNSLDALCKRLQIDNSKRDLHGALLDAHLLAQVYLNMTGGQGSFFDDIALNQNLQNAKDHEAQQLNKVSYQVPILTASEQELLEHENYLQLMQQTGKCLWLEHID